MLLASQVAGALAAGLLVFALACRCGFGLTNATAAIAVVPITAAALLSLPGLHNSVTSFLDQRRINATLSVEQARLEPGTFALVNVPYVSWVDEHLAPSDTFRLVVGNSLEQASTELQSQWILFQLAPNLGVVSPSEADWVVLYDVSPVRYRSSGYRGLEVFEPGYAIARSGDAG